MKKTWLLPDVNVWVALTFDSHPHHPSAKTWFDGLTDELLFFCRMTQQKYDTYLGDPRIAFTGEPTNTDSHWRSLTQGNILSPNVWNDAYLAAFSVAADYELVTFDKGFARYPGLNHTILS